MKTMMPRLAAVAVLMNPGNSTHAAVLKNVEAAAEKLGMKVVPAEARVPDETRAGWATFGAVRRGLERATTTRIERRAKSASKPAHAPARVLTSS
jgi:hypothetical protein